MNLRIGLIGAGTKEWMGGITYVEAIARATATLPPDTRPELFFVLTDENLPALRFYRETLGFCSAVAYRGTHPIEEIGAQIAADLPPGLPLSTLAAQSSCDLLFPSTMGLIDGTKIIGWIPDLQHLRLPEFFSPSELATRTAQIERLLKTRRPLVVSSQSAKADLLEFFGPIPGPLHVLHFHTAPRDEWFRADPAPVVAKHGLPEKFLICCNQFWKHKNHALVFQALELLAQRGIELPLVCTGSTHDPRWPKFFEESVAKIRDNISFPRIHFLGILPRDEQIQLLRASAAMVQPSLFEGWSTVVEDARALGKTLFLSDLPVHREQAPPHAHFFNPSSAAGLAEKIEAILPTLQPGPDREREQAAKIEVDLQLADAGRAFLKIARASARPGVYFRSLPPYARASTGRFFRKVARKLFPQKTS